jgi:hypothetical protein
MSSEPSHISKEKLAALQSQWEGVQLEMGACYLPGLEESEVGRRKGWKQTILIYIHAFLSILNIKSRQQ